MDENLVWKIRTFIYQYFAETARSPLVEETASHFGMTGEEVASAYEELHQRHALFLAPRTHEIQMAWPFSGVKTPFKVYANGKMYFANCAWDSFGIPVALQADAQIEAVCAQSGDPIHLAVRGQDVQESDALVHFLVPFRNWYDDLPFT